jgi:cyanophycin synthetase
LRALHGPSLRSAVPAIVIAVEYSAASELEALHLDLTARSALFQSMLSGLGHQGILSRRLEAAPGAEAVAQVLCWLGSALQEASGGPAVAFRADLGASNSLITLLAPYEEEFVATRAIVSAVDLLRAATSREGELAERVTACLAEGRQHEETSRLLIREMRRRDIPFREISSHKGIIEAGWGHHRRRAQHSVTDQTSRLASDIAYNKHLASTVMRDAGAPTPEQHVPVSLSEARIMARKLGYPVVVKPRSQDMGTAVFANVGDEAALDEAYAEASRHGRVIVETRLPGDSHRILVINNAVVAVSRLVPGRVKGDGKQTIRALVEAENQARRADKGHKDQSEIRIASETSRLLARQGYALDSVLPLGETVALRSAANVALGGNSEDVSALIHPDNSAVALRAARAIGLDVAGVDFISPDISRSYREVGGGICEINPIPGIYGYHLKADAPDVLQIYIDALFPHGANGRIPLIAVHGATDAGLSHAIADQQSARHRAVGLANRDGVWIEGLAVAWGAHDGVSGARMVLSDTCVAFAVLEVGAKAARADGLAFDRAALCVLHGLDQHEPLAVRRAIARLLLNQSDKVAVNLAASGCEAMVDLTDPRIVGYALDPDPATVARWHEAGARVLGGRVQDGVLRLFWLAATGDYSAAPPLTLAAGQDATLALAGLAARLVLETPSRSLR